MLKKAFYILVLANLLPKFYFKNCDLNVELVFAIDVSEEINKNEFDLIKIGLQSFINSTFIDLSKFKIGIFTFADRLKLLKNFDEDFDKNEIISKLIDLELSTKKFPKLLNLALKFAKFLFDSQETSDRIRISVMITDGDLPLQVVRGIRKEANSLKNACHLVALNIGNSPSMVLKLLVSKPDYLLNSIFDLKNMISNILNSSCGQQNKEMINRLSRTMFKN